MIGGKSVVCVGGTFNRLHAGHHALLHAAADVGDILRVGVTTDAFVRRVRGARRSAAVRPYRDRARGVRQFLAKAAPGRARVVPLSDAMAPVRFAEFDAIVVSPDTLPIAEVINAKRRAKGSRLLKIVVVPLIRAHDGRVISSTRIVGGEIDQEGSPARRAAPARKGKGEGEKKRATGRAGAARGARGRSSARTGTRASGPRVRARSRRR